MNQLSWAAILSGLFLTATVTWAQTPDQLSVLPTPFAERNPPAEHAFKGTNAFVLQAGRYTNWFISPESLQQWDNAPTLLFRPDEDFSLSAKVALTPKMRWDSGALIVFADKTHWAKLCLEMPQNQGPLSAVMVVTNGVSDDGYTAIQATDNALYLRIAKSERGIAFYASPDGRKWQMIRAFRFLTDAPVQAGFLAESPVGQGIAVDFSDVRYSTGRLKSFYDEE